MVTMIVFALLTLMPLIADAGGTGRCTTREDPALKRWVTECTDGARAITKWDNGLQRYTTDIVREPQGKQAPR